MQILSLLNNISFTSKKVNALIFNDSHGAVKNITAFEKMQDEFYKQHEGEINLTLSGGDVFMDESPNNEVVAKRLLSRTDAIGVGNHDIERGNYLSCLIDKFSLIGKFFSSNILFKEKTELSNQIIKGKMLEMCDTKIGIVGASPLDFKNLTRASETIDFIDIQDIDETVKSVEKEVASLKEQGSEIIFLLAHTGEFSPEDKDNYYEIFADIKDIGVIIGGHDHRLVDRWIENKHGDIVKVASTGQNFENNFEGTLDMIAKLTLTLDDDGKIDKDKTEIVFEKLETIPSEEDKEVLYTLDKGLEPSLYSKEHSEIANIVADSALWYINKHTTGAKADFGFVNPGAIRANFNNKEVTLGDVRGTIPFVSSTLIKTTLTKEQIIAALNRSVLSTTFGKISPGIMQVSGLEYTVNPDLTVSDVHILNEDGTIKYDLNDYDNDETFTAAYDMFLLSGPEGLDMLKKTEDEQIEHFNASRQTALEEYLRESDSIWDYKTVRINKV